MTDVTGFGLLGHLMEMAEGSGLSAELYYSKIKLIDGVKEYLAQRAIPDSSYRNWNAYSKNTGFEAGVNVMEAFNLLPDPQTNGGLLIAAQQSAMSEVSDVLISFGLQEYTEPIGRFISPGEKRISVKL